MRRRIDGHVHIIQPHPVGWIDPLNHIEVLPNGRIRRPSGDVGQRVPAYCGDGAFPVETLIATMDENGVDKAVIMAHLDSEVCETAYDAIQKYPDRLAGAIAVVPDAAQAETIRFWHEKGIRVLKFELRSMNEMYPGFTLADDPVQPLLKTAEELGMVVAVDPGPTDFPCYRPDCLKMVAQRYPGIKLVICHLGYPLMGLRDRPEIYEKWLETIRLGRLDNVYFDVTAMPDLFLRENFPYPEGITFLKELYETCGAHKLIWGTDMPGTFRNATYTQMIQAFERADFLTESEKDALFYANANVMYFSCEK